MDPSSQKVKRKQKNDVGLQVGPHRKKTVESLKNCRFDSNESVGLANLQNNVMSWTQQGGPFTRGKHRQSKPNTRNMHRQDVVRKMKFMCCCCAGPEKPARRTQGSTPTQRAPKSDHRLGNRQEGKRRQDIKKHSTQKIKKVCQGKLYKARVAGGWCGFGNGQDCAKSSSRKVSTAARGRDRAAPCALSSELTSFGEYINLLPFVFANSKRAIKGISPYGCHTPEEQSTVGKLHQDSKTVLLQEGLYPKVNLCNIGPICVECKQKCSFVIPDNVKSKLVCCFTKEMRAGFRFEPGCLVQKKHSFNESVQVLNNGRLPRLDSERIFSQLTNSNEQTKDVTNNTDSGALSSHREQESNVSACCSTEHRLKLSMNGMQKGCTDYIQSTLEKDLHANNVELGGKADILSEDSHRKNLFCIDPFGSVNCVEDQSESPAQMCSPVCTEAESRGGQSMNLNGPTLENAENLDSFTCQRVRVYQGKNSITCARTYLTWPFLSRKKIPETAGNGDSRAGHEPTDPNRLPQKRFSISNQRLGAEENDKEEALKKADNVVGVSSDIIRNINSLYPSHSSQPSVMILPQKQNSFCKDFTTWLSRGSASVQTAQSPSPNNNSRRSTPSSSRLGSTDTAPNMSTASFMDTNSCLSSISSSLIPLTTSTPNVFRITLPQVETVVNFDSNDSCNSSSLLPQDVEVSWDEIITYHSPPKLEPYFKTSPLNHLTNRLTNACKNNYIDPNLNLPPLLSPLNSPVKHNVSSNSVEFENKNSHRHNHKMPFENPTPEMCDINEKDYDSGWQQKKTFPTKNDVSTFVEPPNMESLVTDTSPPALTYLTDSGFSPSNTENEEQSNGEASVDKESCTPEQSENQDPEEDLEKPEVLDEIEAYEQDILLVDVFQDDPDLFEKVPQKSLLKLGPVRTCDTAETERKKMVKIFSPVPESCKRTHSVTPVNLNFLHHSPEESPRRPWRPQCNSTSALHSNTKKHIKSMCSAEARVVNSEEERTDHFPTENLNHISPQLASRLGLVTWMTNSQSAADIRWQKPAYCRHYFSDSQNCGFKLCRFHHVPMEGDEKFCTETVARFTKTPACLHKAASVYTGYYQNNKPAVFFSKPVLVSLLRGLLQAGMLSDVFSVLRTSLTHNIVPEYEFLLDLFNFIREKSLMSFVPELIQLTFKMASAGLPLSLDCLECVKNTPDLHHMFSSNSHKSLSGHRLVTHPEYLNLAHAVVEMELCTKQEDWKRLGEVFQFICQSNQVSQVERISGRVAVALLSESKDRLTLPFAVFAETAGHNVDEDSPVKSCLGRIGVSLMLRYHKTHQWAKGQKVVEVLSAAKVSYATMKGLFGNEDCTSRCHLISVATELFLLNGSVEGALNILRENEWFLMSSAWPCEAADLEKRTHVLLSLAEKTSHRDTLEVLSNLPGLKEPNGHIDISKYTTFFTAHLQVCLDRQIVVLASDLVNFMLSKNLPVDHTMLQMLLHRLGKQNFWLKAREIFKNSMRKGYHPGVSAPLGLMTLMVPSQLGEIELALTFEMFITMNATAILALPESTTSTMTITLIRTQSSESDYLSAGSRLLAAACIPQPKLGVRYMAVNSTQEQIFTLDIASARRWLRHNHLWANEVWTLST